MTAPNESWGYDRVRVLYRIFLIAPAIGLLLPVARSRGSKMESIDYRQRNYEELKPEANQPAKRANEIFNRLVKDKAPPGIFDPRSWACWNLKCGRLPAPPLPARAGLR